MRFDAFVFIVLFLTIHAAAAKGTEVPIIPKPLVSTPVNEEFMLTKATPIIIADKEAENTGYFLQKELLKYTGIPVTIQDSGTQPAILLSLSTDRSLADKAYRLTMNSQQIHITSSDDEGLFLGVMSLMQIVRQTDRKGDALHLACWDIEDKAYFEWRGVMLDESRHFFGKETVKRILDWMAFYKLNRFHWHLTDQPGWRIEIKQYPRLTLVGGIGNHSDPLSTAAYYTQEDIKEIVAYATERHIEIIPEIDMPGHATAANMAYPEFSGGGSERYPDFTFNPGKDTVYEYLTNILREVDALFPFQKIHLGGDEVHFGNANWKVDPSVQSLMREQELKTLKEVENYFIQRMADSVFRLNNEVFAWDEVVGSDLPIKGTTVLWWRHDKPEELRKGLDKGFNTILCPRLPLYFDFVQDSSHTIGRKWQKGFVPIEAVYDFPSEALMAYPNANKLIKGIQANLWTEALSTDEHIDYMLFPRITALAESAWSDPKKKDYSKFTERLANHLVLFARAGLYYFDPFDPEKFPEYLSPVQRNHMAPDFDELMRLEQKSTD
ncbi:beta-N-acetylhexosaminidase [Parapedobacter sp. 10938]|uniref:beta-N-acetylhexosaminidase n=1 Tax=Parapedobacter flavus TaxID=3110225 RepID=UPI002DBC8122|nr:beta-N-acetylhexosaminidase [Parapedobacter sp. 10938]MEC3880784.1 beta-N-acetylhexosaminidase [Parapedobacter sp. 10938]